MAKKPTPDDIQGRQLRHAASRKVELGGGVNRSAYEKSFRRSSSDGSIAKPNRLLSSHIKEIHDKGAQAFNVGNYVSDNEIGSKTDQGYLSSTQNGRGVSHTWTDPNSGDAVK